MASTTAQIRSNWASSSRSRRYTPCKEWPICQASSPSRVARARGRLFRIFLGILASLYANLGYISIEGLTRQSACACWWPTHGVFKSPSEALHPGLDIQLVQLSSGVVRTDK